MEEVEKTTGTMSTEEDSANNEEATSPIPKTIIRKRIHKVPPLFPDPLVKGFVFTIPDAKGRIWAYKVYDVRKGGRAWTQKLGIVVDVPVPAGPEPKEVELPKEIERVVNNE